MHPESATSAVTAADSDKENERYRELSRGFTQRDYVETVGREKHW
jgi:hypothetical protein